MPTSTKTNLQEATTFFNQFHATSESENCDTELQCEHYTTSIKATGQIFT